MSLPAQNPNPYTNLHFTQYRSDLLDTNAEHQLIDVRTMSEYNQGHLPNAINIPMDQIADRIDEVSQDKPVVFVCASGNRSESVAAGLAEAGYTGLYNLMGGTMIWMMNGLPLD